MVRTQKATGRAVSMPAGLLSGAAVSMGITLTGAAVTAKLLDSEKMRQNTIGYAVLVTLLLASFAGALTAQKRIKRQYLAVSGLSAVIYIAILLSITALFFGGQYEAVGVTCILALGGSALALLVGMRPERGGKRKRIVKANR